MESYKIGKIYLKDQNLKNYKINYLNDFKPFKVHLCYPLSRVLLISPFRNKVFEHDEEYSYLQRIFSNDITVNYLIQNTLNLTDCIENIQFNFGLKKVHIPLDDNLDKVFFKPNVFKTDIESDLGKFRLSKPLISKCFSIKIEPNEMYFENLFTSLRLRSVFAYFFLFISKLIFLFHFFNLIQ